MSDFALKPARYIDRVKLGSEAFKGVAFLTAASVVFLSIEFLRVSIGWNRNGVRLPMALGFVKDILDIGILLLISYGCWPAAGIELFGRLLRVRGGWRVLICSMAAIPHGIFVAYRGFPEVSGENLAASIITGELLYGWVYVLTYVLSCLSKKVWEK